MASSKPMEPAPRCLHQTAVVERKVFLWGGDQDGLPEGHDNQEKKEFLSKVDAFDLEAGSWQCYPTTETPPLGCIGYACVAVDQSIYYFGGECGHDDCYHSTLHRLHVSSMKWAKLGSSLTSEYESKENAGPMQKGYCGMVAFKASDGSRSDALLVIGGRGPTPSLMQHGAKYEEIHDNNNDECLTLTNEQHMFSLVKDKWISPEVTGTAPPPSHCFTLTSIGDNKAAMFGGTNNSCSFNDLMIAEFDLTIDEQSQEEENKVKGVLQWTTISEPGVSHHVMWPLRRSGHATSFLPNHNALMIVGGEEKGNTLCDDSWVFEFEKRIWKKVTLSVEKITNRQFHSLSVVSSTVPHHIVLMTFGGLIKNSCWFKKTAALVQESTTIIFELVSSDDGQWERTIVLEGSALQRSQIFMENDHQVHQILQELKTQDQTLKLRAAELESAGKTSQQLRKVQEELQKANSDLEKLEEEAREKEKIITKAKEEKKQLQERVDEIKLELDQTNMKLLEVEQDKDLAQKQAQEARERFESERKQQVKVSCKMQDAPTEANLLTHVALKLPDKWFTVGILLGIETAKLEGFDSSCKDPNRLWSKVFSQWKQEQKSPYTWDTIISVLNTLEQKTMAAEIRKQLTTPHTN